MAINREVVVKATLESVNRLSPELRQAKADADQAAAAVRKIADAQRAPGPTGAELASRGRPVGGPQAPTGAKLADDIQRAEQATRRLIAQQQMSRNEVQLWELRQKGATESQLSNLRRLQAAQEKAETPVTMEEYRQASRLARAHTITALATTALAATGAPGLGQVGQVVGGALSGAAAASVLGIGGGMLAGGAVGGVAALIPAVASIFQIVEEGAEKARQAAERFKQEAQGAASAILSSEGAVRHLRETGRITETEFSSLAGRFAERVIAGDPEGRSGRARALLAEATAERERLERARLVPAARAPTSIWDSTTAGWGAFREGTWRSRIDLGAAITGRGFGPTTTAPELAAARAAEEALRTAATAGIDRERGAVSFGDVGSIRTRLMEDIGGGSPAARTADATEGLREFVTRWFGDTPSAAAMLAALLRALPPGPAPA